MLRSITALLLFATLLPTAAANIPAAYPQGNADKKSEPAASPQKIAEEIRADCEDVFGRLNKNDPGAATRAKQKRILDNIDALLKQQAPKGSPSSNAPPKLNNPSAQKPDPSPKTSAPQSTAQKPQPKPAGTATESKPVAAAPKPGEGNKPRTLGAKNLEELFNGDGWNLPGRELQNMDAFARERFIRNYEEMLRAYYRNIAENGKRND